MRISYAGKNPVDSIVLLSYDPSMSSPREQGRLIARVEADPVSEIVAKRAFTLRTVRVTMMVGDREFDAIEFWNYEDPLPAGKSFVNRVRKRR